MRDLFLAALEWVTLFIEALGVAVIVAGIVFCGFRFVGELRREDAYHRLRATLGRAILLGLELLVAADIINTVAFEPSINSLIVLAGVVLIRTFLSLSLEVEIEGRFPWQSRSGKATNGSNTESRNG